MTDQTIPPSTPRMTAGDSGAILTRLTVTPATAQELIEKAPAVYLFVRMNEQSRKSFTASKKEAYYILSHMHEDDAIELAVARNGSVTIGGA